MPTTYSKPESEQEFRSRVPAFRASDPNGWFEEFTGYMMRQDQAHLALINERPDENHASDSSIRRWNKRNDYCISYLQEAVAGPTNRSAKLLVFKYENRNKSAKELCELLIEEFFIQDPRIIHAAQEHFVGMRMVEGEKGTSFITRIEEANETLRRVGKILDPEIDLVGRLIAGLEKDPRYLPLASALKLKKNLQWIDAVRLVQADDQAHSNDFNGQGAPTESANAAFIESTRIVCQMCKNPGHSAHQCRYRYKRDGNSQDGGHKQGNKNQGNKNHGGNTQGKTNRGAITCYFCKKTGHIEKEGRAKKSWLQKKGLGGKESKNNKQEPTQLTGQKRKHGWDDQPEEFSGMARQQSAASNSGRN